MKFIQKNLLMTAVLTLLVLGGVLALFNNYQVKPKSEAGQTEQKKTVAKLEITADNKTKHYNLTEGVGKTALEVTQTATGNKVVATGTGVNAFVTSINNRSAETSKREFWKLVINGKDSAVGAGSYLIKENDTIAWKIDTY